MIQPTTIFSVLMMGLTLLPTDARPQQRLSMDFNWKFVQADPPNAQEPAFDDKDWRTVNVPHDWSIEGAYDQNAPGGGNIGYLPTGIGWYRKQFTIPKNALAGKVWVQFDGVYMNSEVWINGHHLGHRPYGYSTFHYDLTPHLREGENVLAVRVDNSKQPNSRWYTGSGIYRHVWLILADQLHIGHWGIAVTTPAATSDSATVLVKTQIENEHKNVRAGTLTSTLIGPNGELVNEAKQPFTIKPEQDLQLIKTLRVKEPRLWSIESPKLYALRSTIHSDGKLVDQMTTTVGIRQIRYDASKGFFLNGKPVKMHGVNLHHDGGPVGAAVPEGVWERRLRTLKEMGVNAIRTAHNPPAPEFLDLCDRLGLLVMDEAFDEWTAGKRTSSYHLYYDEWHEEDLTAMILRDRNHPSVVLWSVGNEIGEQTTENGTQVLKSLMDIFHRIDPSRPVTAGCDHIADDSKPTKIEFLEAQDIVGYNYVDRWHEHRELFYTPDKLAHPDRKMIGTESANIYGIRGNYQLGNDLEKVRPNYNFNMIRVEQLWKFVAMHDYVIGDFMWTGIDYLGEARWPNKHASSGVLDLAGFKKDAFYFYKSQWTAAPVLHLFPHWNWPNREGQAIPVLAYTNCDAVELFLNGKSFGEKRLEFPRQGTSGGWNSYEKPRVFPTTADLHLSWDVPYEPGVLKAIGKREGQVVVTKEVRTTGVPAAVRLSLDNKTLNADGRDVAHLQVEIVDSEEMAVPTADNLVQFDIKGEGRIIGVDNGNPKDHDSPKAMQRRAFNGLCLAIVRAARTASRIRVQVNSDGLKGGEIEIITKKPQNAQTVVE